MGISTRILKTIKTAAPLSASVVDAKNATMLSRIRKIRNFLSVHFNHPVLYP